jgi:energy-coupling factor transporter transmembrane protein EcfT
MLLIIQIIGSIIILGIPLGIISLFYLAFRKIGYEKVGRYFAIIYSIVVLILFLLLIFQDELFTVDDAIEKLEKHKVALLDNSRLVKNESYSGLGDSYQIFTLEISKRDKENLITKIKSAANFKMLDSTIKHLPEIPINRYFGPTLTQNYEMGDQYVNECF